MSIYLFVQKSCRACVFTEVQLRKVTNWEKTVKIIDVFSETGEKNELACKYDVKFTPTLIIADGDDIIKTISGAKEMGFSFWQSIISEYGGT